MILYPHIAIYNTRRNISPFIYYHQIWQQSQNPCGSVPDAQALWFLFHLAQPLLTTPIVCLS